MTKEHFQVSKQIGGAVFSIEVGKLAKQADGAAVVRYGDTVVLSTACAQKKPRVGVDFFPLTVDYREYTYAAGKIPGGFFKREGRPSEKEILTSRLIDRPLRPLFQDGFNAETQVIASVLSADPEVNPDVLAVNAASTALYVSPIPFHRPIAAVRVGMKDDQFVVFPSYQQLVDSPLNLIVAGTKEAVVMVEGQASELGEEKIQAALRFGHDIIRELLALQEELFAKVHPQKRAVTVTPIDETLRQEFLKRIRGPLQDIITIKPKIERQDKEAEFLDSLLAEVPAEETDKRKTLATIFHDAVRDLVRDMILVGGKRPDGRAFDEVRPITCEVGVLPRTHGSALFTRGETQALVTATLGTREDIQIIDALEGDSERRFMLHYNFPPFSVGEVKMMRGPSRRDIGHGGLASRSVERMMPAADDFPYTVRVVSDILESNGSSSMASVCGATLALMDAGVPVKAPVAGIAMGLVSDGNRFAVLSDIAGYEDHFGDMDFKVAGTADGVTAVQMDIKIEGVSSDILAKALAQARAGRLHILERMLQTLEKPRTETSVYAPRIRTIYINRDKIREVIGPGGKTIRSIIERTGARIDIDDSGRVDIASTDEASSQMAIDIINELVAEAELGKTYLGRVQRVVDFGAFVEILPGTDGLLHVSEMSEQRIKNVRDEIQEGQEVLVKVIEIDATGRIRLSRKALLNEGKGGGASGEGAGAERTDRNSEGRGGRGEGRGEGPGEGRGGRGEGPNDNRRGGRPDRKDSR